MNESQNIELTNVLNRLFRTELSIEGEISNKTSLSDRDIVNCVNFFKRKIRKFMNIDNFDEYKVSQDWFSCPDRDLIKTKGCNLEISEGVYKKIPFEDFLINWPDFAGLCHFWSNSISQIVIIIMLPKPDNFTDTFREFDRIVFISNNNGLNDLLSGTISQFSVVRTNAATGLARIKTNVNGICMLVALNNLLTELSCGKINYDEMQRYQNHVNNNMHIHTFEEDALDLIGRTSNKFFVKASFYREAKNLNSLLSQNPELKDESFIITGRYIYGHHLTDKVEYGGHALTYSSRTGMIKDYNIFETSGTLCPHEYDTGLVIKAKASDFYGSTFMSKVKYAYNWVLNLGASTLKIPLLDVGYHIIVIQCIPNNIVNSMKLNYVPMTDPDINQLGRKRRRDELNEMINDVIDYQKKYKDSNIKKVASVAEYLSYDDRSNQYDPNKYNQTYKLKIKKP